jgi:hypothetical protein
MTMKGITVTRNPQIKLTLTADDWQLFDDEDHPARDRVARGLNANIQQILSRRDIVAHDLNANIQQILNDFDRTDREKMQACWNCLRMYDSYGASDSEGMAVLATIFSEFFGPEYEEA